MLNNKKKNAFTITELVIVIAVIAILAAVLIPTFSNVIEKANESAALQEARNALTNFKIYAPSHDVEGMKFISGNYSFTYTDGELTKDDTKLEATKGTTSDMTSLTLTLASGELVLDFGKTISVTTFTAEGFAGYQLSDGVIVLLNGAPIA